MRRIQTAANQHGFTLIEVLIIAPLVILAVSGFIALMVAMVGDVLQTRDQNVLTYDAQDALDRIEQDAHLSTKFLSTSGTLSSPQGSDGGYTGTAAFSSSNSIIFSEPATDQSSTSPTRNLIYYAYQPNACGFNETFNKIFTIQVVYFINNGSLWRRTIVPPYNTNATVDANTICNDFLSTNRPWAQNTCSPGYTASLCETNDEEIMKNIDSFTTKYYSSPSGTTDIGAANAENATTIDVTINGKKTTAGRSFTTSNSLRVSRINNLDVDVLAPDTPVITHTFPTPDKVTFSWNAVSTAATYSMSYNINGGTWQNSTLSNSTTSYTINANRGDTVSFKLIANGGTQSSPAGTDAATMDLWTDLSLKNGWTNYGGTTFTGTAQFTKSPDGTVFLKGLVKGGTVTSGTVIATLPTGYRPAGKLIYESNTSPYSNGRIDIDSTGDILFNTGSNAYMSLDGIAFLPSTSPYTWGDVTLSNGWTQYGGSYEPVHTTIDGVGRVHTQGLARAGTTTSNTTIAQPVNSTGYQPTGTMHFPSMGSNWSDFWVWHATPTLLVKRDTQTTSYMSLQSIYYPGSTGTWTALPTLQNGWVNYGNGTDYPLAQYTKASDKVVTLRGVIKSGTTGHDILLTTLPAGYRPPERQLFVVVANDAYGRIDIDSDGKVYLEQVSSTWTSLNLSFIVN